MSLTVTEQAYAKVNLCLFVGPTRPDGRHEVVSLFDSVRLADELVVAPRVDGTRLGDEVVCAGVSGPNLVADALAGLRAAGWAAPPVRVEIFKRIPVAAGLGGGSADAAAMLRCAPRLAPVASDTVMELATAIGADVPSQVRLGPSLGTGAGEIIASLEGLAPYAVLVLPQRLGLSTPEVYREADRLGTTRSAAELVVLRDRVRDSLPGPLPDDLLVNDLEPAALSLRPELAVALERARSAGAESAIVCGSGPTVIGVFHGEGAAHRARAAAAERSLAAAFPGAIAATPFRSAQSPVRS